MLFYALQLDQRFPARHGSPENPAIKSTFPGRIRWANPGMSGLRLRLKAVRDGGILRIEFTDSGPGMAQELMDEINGDLWQREKNGHHIGIGNMLDRLKLIYDGRAEIRFSRDDGDLGGTRVRIAVPAADTERNEEHE